MECGLGYIRIRYSYSPYSICLRGTIGFRGSGNGKEAAKRDILGLGCRIWGIHICIGSLKGLGLSYYSP